METKQLEKLPKWAREEIQRLENYKNYLEEKLAQFEGKEETNTFIENLLQVNPLPKNARIVFKIGESKKNKVRFYIKENGDIDVNSDSTLGQIAVIMPRASNSFYIRFID